MSIEYPNRVFAVDDLKIDDVVGQQPDRRSCSVGELELNYLVWGSTELPPVILVHGGKDHCRNWDWTVKALIDRYCVITPDMRGHGDSGRAAGGGYDSEVYISDFTAFMDHLEADGFATPIPLIGHSMGGAIVLSYSAAFPEKVSRVIAMEGLGPSRKMYEDFMAKPPAERLRDYVGRRQSAVTRTQRRFDDPEQMVQRMATAHMRLSEEQARHLALHAARKYPDGWGWKHDPQIGFFRPARMVSPDDYHGPLFRNIDCPVLLMRGAESWASDPVEDGRIEYFQNARLINYEGAGHWLHHDDFDAFIRDVRSFLEDEEVA